MDCMEGMKTFPDNYFDLAIVDPPYGINAGSDNRFGKYVGGATKRKDYDKKEWDSKVPTQGYFNELNRVSKNQIVWGANYYSCLTGGMIVWNKDVPPNYTKSKCEIAYKSHGVSVDYVKIMWHGMLQENMKDKELRIHPTQKPVQLYKWILHNYAKPDFKILDTHVGSASSIIAFLDFGCDWIGFEIDEDYHKAATKRIEIHKQQLKLFC